MSNAIPHPIIHTPQVLETARAGYHDALAGLGYRREYDVYSEWQQRNYESGRLVALELMSRSSKPAAWPSTGSLPNALLPVIETVKRSFVRQP
jgi:hypothetical protein